MKAKILAVALAAISLNAMALEISIRPIPGHGHGHSHGHGHGPGHWTHPGHVIPSHPGHPGHGPVPRVVSIFGNGSGGSTHGDKPAACARAQERARADAYSDCARLRGQVLNVFANSCSCHGPKSDIVCRTTATGSCRVWSRGTFSADFVVEDFTQDLAFQNSAEEISDFDGEAGFLNDAAADEGMIVEPIQ